MQSSKMASSKHVTQDKYEVILPQMNSCAPRKSGGCNGQKMRWVVDWVSDTLWKKGEQRLLKGWKLKKAEKNIRQRPISKLV